MIYSNRHVVLIPKPRPRGLFSMDEIAERCDVHLSFVEKLYRLGIIDPHPEFARLFPNTVTIRVRKVVRLQEDLGVNPQGAAVILDLLGKIDELKARVRMLSGEF